MAPTHHIRAFDHTFSVVPQSKIGDGKEEGSYEEEAQRGDESAEEVHGGEDRWLAADRRHDGCAGGRSVRTVSGAAGLDRSA